MRDEFHPLEDNPPAAPSWEVDDDASHVMWWHDCTVHEARVGCLLPNTMAGWQITQLSPLTVVPSILCRGCGTHGWIRAGEWVSA